MIGPANSEKPSRSALRRQREKEQRYATILRSAEELFVAGGYHGTSMEQIAEMAEFSVGSLYFYFRNKEDLLIKLLDEISFHIRDLIGNKFRQAEPTLDAFMQAGYAFFEDFCLKHPDRMLILLRESVGQGKAVEERRKSIFDALIHDVLDALSRVSQNTGLTFRSDLSTRVIATSIVGMFERIAYRYHIWKDRPENLTIMADDAMRFIMGGIDNLAKKG